MNVKYIFMLQLLLLSYYISSNHKLPANIYMIGSSQATFSYRFIRDVEFSVNNTTAIFKIRSYPGLSMHRLTHEGLGILNLDWLDIKPADIMVFMFGSIDCSFNIGKQRDKFNRNLTEIIDTLIANFIKIALAYKQLKPDIIYAIHEVMPPSTSGYGTLEDRCVITQLFNKTLKKACLSANLIYIEINDLCCDKNGAMLADLFYDGIHMNPDRSKPLKVRVIKTLLDHKIL